MTLSTGDNSIARPASVLPYVTPPDPDADFHRQSGKRLAVFILTWVAYASYYFGRKGLSVVKSTLQERQGIGKDMLGAIDTGYLAAYAAGQFVSGVLGDRIGSRRLIGLGMIGVAIACVAFGMASTAGLLLIAYVANGFFQSTGWPGTCKSMGDWFTQRERGTVMGIWSTCYQAGGLAATAVATWLFIHFNSWRWAFYGPAIIIALVGVVNLLFLPERARTREGSQSGPAVAGLPLRGRNDVPDEARSTILRSPVLWSLGSAYFCVKLIRYSILFWLPYYLNTVLGYSKAQSGYQSISFEVGGIVGSIVIGLISDRYFPGRRRLISAITLALLAGALFAYTRLAPISMFLNFAGMAVVGFCLFGPDTIIAGAAAQDLGGKHDVAKAAGFINGMGSVGAVLQGFVTARVSDSRFGWNGLFYVFVLLALLSSVALLIGKRKN